MNKVKLSDFTSVLIRVHNELVHYELESIPFDLISPYVRELMFLEQVLTCPLIPTSKIAQFHGISDERASQLIEFNLLVGHLFDDVTDVVTREALCLWVFRTLRIIYELTYGIKSLSTDCCKEA